LVACPQTLCRPCNSSSDGSGRGPTLAEPLADLGLLTVLQPEWFVDQQLADRLAGAWLLSNLPRRYRAGGLGYEDGAEAG
jgi:hypothetical protein